MGREEVSYMTVREAAALIGCSMQHVRTLIRGGRLKARKLMTPVGPYWDLDTRSVKRFAAEPQTTGYPRGQPRTPAE